MPAFPKSLASPFRRSYTSSDSSSPVSPKPRPRTHRRWTCPFLFPRSRRRRQPLPEPYPEAPQPHYFDSYTGTWSPRKVPITPAGRSGVWSPRAIASRIGTPSRRPTTPAPPLPPPPPVIVTDSSNVMSITATTTIPEEVEVEEIEEKKDDHSNYNNEKNKTTGPHAWNLSRRAPPTPSSASATHTRPPSRGKQFPPPQYSKQSHQQPQPQHPSPPTSKAPTTAINNKPLPLSPNTNPTTSSTATKLDSHSKWVVTQVPLPAHHDTEPRSRDFADFATAVPPPPPREDAVIENNAEKEGEKVVKEKMVEGKGEVEKEEGKEVGDEEKVYLEPVLHQMSVLPAVETAAVAGTAGVVGVVV